MNNTAQALMFGKASDEWQTPQGLFAALDAEFHFVLDLAATKENRKTELYLGPDRTDAWDNALVVDWAPASNGQWCWLNPPYSRCAAFMSKAAQEASLGCHTVCLVPSRTDTKWWHSAVWDADWHKPRSGVEIRFIKGRLKFEGTGKPKNSAPFPSVLVIFGKQ